MTQREQQVLAMIGRGYSIPKIAEKLFRSQKTIETHRQSLGRKLGASNRVELARIAIQVGLAPLHLEGDGGGVAASDHARQHLGGDDRAAAVVSRIESACASVVDVAYARALCEALTDGLDLPGAGLFTWEYDGTAIQSLAWRYGGQWNNEVRIPVAGTHCEAMLAQPFFRNDGPQPEPCPDFPGSESMNIVGCMGCRLDDPLTKDPIGSLLVFSDQPGPFEPAVETVMRVCAVRAAAELSRVCLIDSLQRSVESLEERLADLEDGEDA